MHCFELSDRGVTRGFSVHEDPVAPRVNVTPGGDFFLPIDSDLAPLIREARKREENPDSVLRMRCATVMQDGESLTSANPGQEALVKINISAAPGGKVTITSANDRGEVLKGRRVEVSFGPFPSTGISVLLPISLPVHLQPWTTGAERLDLVAVMAPGSEFRIVRSKAATGVRPIDWVKWTGYHLLLNSERKRSSSSSIETTERV